MNEIDFGDLPTWITAVTSLFALIAATFAAFFTWRTLRIESSREARTEIRIEEDQANKIACWISDSNSENFELSGYKYKAIGVNMNVSNASQQVIYEVTLTLFDKDSEIYEEHISVIPPESTSVIAIPVEIIDRYLPSHLKNIIGTVVSQADKESKRISGSLLLEVKFMDSKGVFWARGRKGNLVKI
jgi:hypothetical protein